MTKLRFLRVLTGEAVWPPPIWLMRQAGRYLPEFRALRDRADFLTRCLTPDLATEITLQPIRRYRMDVAILFSDILMIPWGLGQGLDFVDGEGPVLPPIRSEDDVGRLDLQRLTDRIEPIMETVRRLRTAASEMVDGPAVLGFAGSPFTVACYMVEGRGSREFGAIRRMAYEAPALLERLLDLLVTSTIGYLERQIDAGAHAVMLFDSWAGLLPPPLFDRLVIAPTRAICQALRSSRPGIRIIGFPRLAGVRLAAYVGATGVDGLGVDTSVDLAAAAAGLPGRVALQGNLDPLCLVSGGTALSTEVARIGLSIQGRPHIFNLGHGILPETPPEHVEQLVAEVRAL